MPDWLEILARVSLITAAACAVAIVIDILRGHPQKMWIMNVVWPVTALWAGPFGLTEYFRTGRQGATGNKSLPQAVAVAATHCGAGCTLGDIAAEWLHLAWPLTIAREPLFGAWLLDYIFAFSFGIAFQYFTIVPMRHLTFGKGLVQALKADSLSLTSWQAGMYGWMALATFGIFAKELRPSDPAFWFLMQIAMGAGFLTSYPVNWWLVTKGIKEKM